MRNVVYSTKKARRQKVHHSR